MRECREYALQTNEAHGVWGGLNERERRLMKRRRQRHQDLVASVSILEVGAG